jgi:hypothetical protein
MRLSRGSNTTLLSRTIKPWLSAFLSHMPFLLAASGVLAALTAWALYRLLIEPRFNPLHQIAGPPCSLFGGNLRKLLECVSAFQSIASRL